MLDSIHGALSGAMPSTLVLIATIAVVATLAFTGTKLVVSTLVAAVWLWLIGTPLWLMIVLAVPAVVLNVPPLRRAVITQRVLRLIRAKGMLPAVSETERTAIEAGTVWIDKDLFSGHPDFRRLLREPYPGLSTEEQAFMDGPVEEACRLTDDWQVWKQRDLPAEVWDFLKAQRFFGIIIPKEYGGLGFSASANSAIVQKLSSRSLPLGISVMVPNSLGPAELLVHYGTAQQKDHYLPRLARGEEMPCFALTEPGAGSDATSLTSRGVVFRREDGELCVRLTWDKRYISLAAISTVLGLAVQLEDPDNLLGAGTHPGITCVLVPTETPGVHCDRRHDPLGVPFYNCPTHGEDVVVPVDAIIGGRDGAGQGWRMLTECLAAGRGISLPASSSGGVKVAARVASAHAAVRKQFGMPIGKFEGIQEPLARIGGFAYIMEAARRYTCGALDNGAKPAVITAIAKYNFTELARLAVNDGMDVLGGNAISRGPRNLLAHGYMGMPISITVEGANILTRTLMIFGQGAIRCHPFAYPEIKAASENDVVGFDRAFFGHIGHLTCNGVRSALLHLSRGWLARAPVAGPEARYYRKLAWASASFAFLADVAMAGLGGDLKRKESITGRFADIFSWLYLGTATLRRFAADGRPAEDLPFVHWSMHHALARMQTAFEGLFANLRIAGLGWWLRGPLALWWRLSPLASPPSDAMGRDVARALQTPGPQRDRLLAGVYLPADESQALHRLEHAFDVCTHAEHLARKIKEAVKAGKLAKADPAEMVASAQAQGVLTPDEVSTLAEAELARTAALTVDSFTLDEYLAMGGETPKRRSSSNQHRAPQQTAK